MAAKRLPSGRPRLRIDPPGESRVDPQRMHKTFRLFVLTYLLFWSWMQLLG